MFSKELHKLNFVTCNVEGIYKPSKASLNELKSKFKTLYTTEVPIILVFASCWSHYSPINTFLCARGIFAVLALKKERSNLTLDKVFKLNEEQRAYLKMVVDDRMIDGRLITKDLIIAGKYH